METAEKVLNVNIEILKVLKEINAKLDTEKQFLWKQDEGSKTAQTCKQMSGPSDAKEDTTVSENEQELSVLNDNRYDDGTPENLKRKPHKPSSLKRWRYRLSEPERFDDPSLNLPILQELLGDWWRIPNDSRVPLIYGVRSGHEWSVYRFRREDLMKFKEYTTLFFSHQGRDCFVLDTHGQNKLIIYRAGQPALYFGDHVAPLNICQKDSNTAPWSRLM